jgi:hypothetical protein
MPDGSNSQLGTVVFLLQVRRSYAVKYHTRATLLAVLSEYWPKSCNPMHIADLCGDQQG